MSNITRRERTAVENLAGVDECRVYHFLNVVHSGSVPKEQTRLFVDHPVAELIFERVPWIESILIHGTNLWISKSAAASWDATDSRLDECWKILGYSKLESEDGGDSCA